MATHRYLIECADADCTKCDYSAMVALTQTEAERACFHAVCPKCGGPVAVTWLNDTPTEVR